MCEVKHETEKPGVGVNNYLHGVFLPSWVCTIPALAGFAQLLS